jgi:tetratricopeptide (TPR) repeat protein
MTDAERYTTIGSYFSSGERADREQAIEAYEALLAIDSLNPTAINNLARQLTERREWARSESLLRRALSAGIVRATILSNLGNAQVLQGKFAAADSTTALALREFPSNSIVRTFELFVLTGRKQYDSLDKRAARLLANDPDPANRAMAAFYLRELAFVGGRGQEGLRLAENAFAIDEARGNPTPILTRPLDSAFAEIHHMAQPARAVQRLDAARARPEVRSLRVDDRRYFDIAITYAQAGRPDRARAVLAEYQAAAAADTAYRRRTTPYHHQVLGEIALAERRPADAIRELRLADRLPDGPRDVCVSCTLEPLARAFDAAGMADSAVATYERYVRTPSSFVWPDTHGLARAHRRLGELYDSRGNVARARQNYAKFVDLWKNADPVLQPAVARARERLAALGSR